jgi:PAS domain S-box-containing protein
MHCSIKEARVISSRVDTLDDRAAARIAALHQMRREIDAELAELEKGATPIERPPHLSAAACAQADLFNQVSDAIIATDAAFRIIAWNAAAARIYGWPAEEVIGQQVDTLLRTRFVSRTREDALARLLTDHMVDVEVIHLDCTGREVWMHAKVMLLCDDDGAVTGTLGVMRDITTWKLAAEALRESDRRFRLLIDSMANIAVQGYGADGTIHYWNRANEAVYGYTAEEALGENLVELIIPPPMRDFVRAAIRQGGDTGEMPPAAEMELMRKDGSLVPVYSSHAVVRLPGQEPELFCLDVDLTPLRQAETASRESEALFRTVAEESPAALFIVQNDVFVFVNAAACAMSGYAPEELLQHAFLDFLNPGDRQQLEHGALEMLAGRPVQNQYELEFRTKGGDRRWAVFSANMMTYHGQPAVLVIGQDITNRKEYEEALLEANRAKNEFLAVLSHELQTPLTAMLGWSAEALRAGTPEIMARAMPVIHRNAVRQKRLVDDLLDMSRLIHHKIVLNREPADLNAQAQHAVENSRHLAEERQLRLVVVPAPEPLPILADPARLQQCLGNLLGNSMKFSPPASAITVTCWRDGDQACCRVEDAGRGIPPAALPTLFQAFRQVDRDERYGGLGLGLAVTQGIISLHGGSIAVESDGPECGCRCTITLPIAHP